MTQDVAQGKPPEMVAIMTAPAPLERRDCVCLFTAATPGPRTVFGTQKVLQKCVLM